MFRLAKRGLELVVFGFAAYAFATVPLGTKTGLQHLKAILSTQEAKEAGTELKGAGSRVLQELLEFDAPSYEGQPKVPPLHSTAGAPSATGTGGSSAGTKTAAQPSAAGRTDAAP